MTQLFTSRAELIPAGENTEKHSIANKAEAATLERDKSDTDPRTGGLFRGCFRGCSIPHAIIRDVEDGVERCPNCAWELEDGYCDSCGINYGSDVESYYGESIPSDFDQSETEMTASDGFHEHIPDYHDDNYHTHDLINGWDGGEPVEVGDDISLDGHGRALHALNAYNGEFAFEREVARALAGRPIRRNGSPATAHTPRHYAPSMLSEVTTTYSVGDGLSDMEDEIDENGGEDVDEEDEEDEEDEDSLSGFIVQDEDGEIHTLDCHMNRTRARSEDTDVQEQIDPTEHFHPEHSNEQHWVDDSAEDSDSRPHSDDEAIYLGRRMSSSPSNSSSEDEVIAPPLHSRKRRRIVTEISSDEESDSEEESVRSRPRRRLSSSGSATVGRQSPELGSSRAIPNRPMPRTRHRAPAAPTVPEPESTDSESDLPPMPPSNNRASRHRRPINRRQARPPRRSRENSNFTNTQTSREQRHGRDNSSTTTTYGGSNFSRMQPDLAPPPLAIRRGVGASRRRQTLRNTTDRSGPEW